MVTGHPTTDAQLLAARYGNFRSGPFNFYRDVWGQRLWSGQHQIFTGAFAHRKFAVKAGHALGKSHIIGRIAISFLGVCQAMGQPGLVVTTAPTWSQVENIIWAEIRTAHTRARMPLGGDLLTTKLTFDSDTFAMGLSTKEGDRFQGLHSQNILVIIDEGSGVPQIIWEAADSLMSSGNAHMLALGNPLEPAGPFFDIFKAGSGWQKLTLSCLDCPNVQQRREVIPGLVTHTWVDEKKDKWGEDSPLYQARVLGQFPKLAISRVAQGEWVDSCINRPIDWAQIRRFVSADIADYGDDKTVAYGFNTRKPIKQLIYGKVGPMETAGNLVTLCDAIDGQAIVLDGIGVGTAVAEKCRELIGTRSIPVMAVKGSESPTNDQYGNMRAEMALEAAEFMRDGDCQIPNDELLIEELKMPTYHIRRGKQWVQDKDEIKAELGRSPDRADAFNMGLWFSAHCPVLESRQEAMAIPGSSTARWVQQAQRDAAGVGRGDHDDNPYRDA